MNQLSQAESDREEQVLKLASAGFSTRNIARAIGDISQSTVVRILRKAGTGPQKTLEEQETAASRRGDVIVRTAVIAVLALLLVTFIVLTAAVATIAWS